MQKKIFLFFFLTSMVYSLVSRSNAIEIESPRFRIDVDKIGFENTSKSSSQYSLQTRFGNNVESITSQGKVSFSLNPSVSTLSKINTQSQFDLEYSSSSGYQISLIQEYALKNSNGDAIENAIYYFRGTRLLPIPNENKGEFPTTLAFGKQNSTNDTSKVRLKLNPQSIEINRMYETVINFIALPGY